MDDFGWFTFGYIVGVTITFLAMYAGFRIGEHKEGRRDDYGARP